MVHYIFYLIFVLGLLIETISVYCDNCIYTGRGKNSGAWSVASGLFWFLGT